MSMKNKLDGAYQVGVSEERGRILWILDDETTWLHRKLKDVVLVESQRHALQVKVKIVAALFRQLRLRIASGDGPMGGSNLGDEPDATSEEEPQGVV